MIQQPAKNDARKSGPFLLADAWTTEWREGHIADVFTFRNGKAIQFRTFGDEQQAFEWVGIKAPHKG